jgi:hypothetical protein
MDKCLDCGGNDMIVDSSHGDLVCTRCGLVAESHLSEAVCNPSAAMQYYSAWLTPVASSRNSTVRYGTLSNVTHVIRTIAQIVPGEQIVSETDPRVVVVCETLRKNFDACHIVEDVTRCCAICIISSKLFNVSNAVDVCRRLSITSNDMKAVRVSSVTDSILSDTGGNAYKFVRRNCSSASEFIRDRWVESQHIGTDQLVERARVIEKVINADVEGTVALALYAEYLSLKTDPDYTVIENLTRVDKDAVAQLYASYMGACNQAV